MIGYLLQRLKALYGILKPVPVEDYDGNFGIVHSIIHRILLIPENKCHDVRLKVSSHIYR